MRNQGSIVRGQIVEALPGAMFRVKVEGQEILCYVAGRMRINHVKTMPGDVVEIVLSPDGARGRIIKRL